MSVVELVIDGHVHVLPGENDVFDWERKIRERFAGRVNEVEAISSDASHVVLVNWARVTVVEVRTQSPPTLR